MWIKYQIFGGRNHVWIFEILEEFSKYLNIWISVAALMKYMYWHAQMKMTKQMEDSTWDDEYLPVNTTSSSECEQLNDDDDCDDGNEYYEIENTHPEHIQQLPVYPIENHIVQLSEDEADEWKVEQNDVNLWPCGPFLLHPSTIIDVIPPLKPETFFNTLFDDRMWNLISESTNLYAASNSRKKNGKSTKYINVSNCLLLSN